MSKPDDNQTFSAATLTFVLGDVELQQSEVAQHDENAGRARYHVLQELGRGGLGEVHSAMDRLLEREVALKSALQHSHAALADFWHEAKVTALLDHPAIVPIYDAGTRDGNRPFFTMKRVEGDNLAQVLAGSTPPSERARLEIFRRVCEAIEYAHDKGWLHRDLKPDNVMLGAYGEVLVVDWGLAWSMNSQVRPKAAGTPAYMAPEQVTGSTQDGRTDVYALGGVLWFLLTGSKPWGDHGAQAVVGALKAGQTFRPPPGRIPPELHAILERALAPDPEHRYPSVKALHDDIEAYVDGELVSAARYTAGQRLAKWADKNRRTLWTGIGVGGIVVAIAAAALGSTGVAVWRSANASAAAAQRAQAAEARTRQELSRALVASSTARVAAGHYDDALDDLLQADAVVDAVIPALAWTDVTSRGLWPVSMAQVSGPTVALLNDGEHAWTLAHTGEWARIDLRDGTADETGAVRGRALAWLEPDRLLTTEDADLVLRDRAGQELARTSRQHPGVRIEAAWVGGDRIFAQSWSDDAAPPVAAWTTDLQPVQLPDRVGGLYIQGVSPDGLHVLGSERRAPNKNYAGEVRRTADGATVLESEQGLRVVLSDGWLFNGRRDGLVGTSLLDGQTVRGEGFVGYIGDANRSSLVFFDEAGMGRVIDPTTGEHQTHLLGMRERPLAVDLDPAGRWVTAVGAQGTVASWALPETPVGFAEELAAKRVVPHPGGRLVALSRDDGIRIVDVPSGRTLLAVPGVVGHPEPAWSPDGRRLFYTDDGRPTLLDAVSGERRQLSGSGGAARWTDEALVVHTPAGIERRNPRSLALTEAIPVPGTVWDSIQLDDGSVVFSANKRADDAIALRVPATGEPELWEGGGGTDHVGFGVEQLPGGRLAFGRQDGRVVVRAPNGEPDEEWRWQSAPVLGLRAHEDGVLAATYDGRLHQTDGKGQERHAAQLVKAPLWWVEVIDGHLFVGSPTRGASLPLDGRPPAPGQARVRAARAWSLVTAQSPQDQLTVAVGLGSGVDEALGEREDAVAEILRGFGDRVRGSGIP